MATENQTVKQASGLITVLWAKPRVRTLARYAAALALCLLVLAWCSTCGARRASGHTFIRATRCSITWFAKSVIDHGWFLDVPLLGAPGQLNLRDVPTSDNNLHGLLLRLLALNTSHYPSVLNNFFLLTFPLVFLCALWVLRPFRLGLVGERVGESALHIHAVSSDAQRTSSLSGGLLDGSIGRVAGVVGEPR
jgi:hypothetical protein